MTCDIWRGVKILSNFSSLALILWDRQCLEDSELKDELPTPGLLIVKRFFIHPDGLDMCPHTHLDKYR